MYFKILITLGVGFLVFPSFINTVYCVPVSVAPEPEIENDVLQSGDENIVPRDVPPVKSVVTKPPAVPAVSGPLYRPNSTPKPERNKFGELIHGNWQNVFKNVVALPSKVVSRIKGAVDGYFTGPQGPPTEKRIITVDLPLPDLPYFDQSKSV